MDDRDGTSEMTSAPDPIEIPSAGGVVLAGYRWQPEQPPRGIVQLVHGVGEHSRRYDRVAQACVDAGFVVYAHDHRGHGRTATDPQHYGVLGEGGWTELVADIGRVGAVARAAHPALPLGVVAHSLGSFATQQYLLDHSADVDAVVLSGTAAIDLIEPAMDLDAPMDLTAFNAAFSPPRTDFDWLSRDDAEVDKYLADPACGFGLDVAGSRAMFAGARRVADPAEVANMRASLPVYIVVGELDPVNAGLALVTPLVQRYEDAGLSDVTFVSYPGARHEVFNETNRDEVVGGVVGWLGSRLARSRS